MKVLFVHSRDDLYGADAALLELVRRLPEHGIEPIVVLPSDLPYEGKLGNALERYGIESIKLDIGVVRTIYKNVPGIISLSSRFLKGALEIKKLVGERKIDLVHSNTSSVLSGALAAKLAGVPHVWHVREIVSQSETVRYTLIWMVVNLSDRIIAISDAVAEHIIEAYPSRKEQVEVIQGSGIDTKLFSPETDGSDVRRKWGVSDEEFLVGVVGKIHPTKGQDLLIEAAPIVKRRAGNVKFAIVGDVQPGMEGLRDRLGAHARELGVADDIIWAGHRADIPQVMAALDLLVIPSTSPEPLGRSMLEAMACGTPVVAAAHGGPLEVIRDGENGLLFPPNDPAALAVAIIQMAQEPEWRDRISRAARDEIVRNYDADRYTERIIELYQEILTHR